jgi:hypothetical protein
LTTFALVLCISKVLDILSYHTCRQWLLISVPSILASFWPQNIKTFYLNFLTPNRPEFNMATRKSQRAPAPITIWEEKKAPSAASDPKITKKTARNRPESALKAVIAGPLPESTKFDNGTLQELDYHPPLNLRSKSS